MDWQEIVNKCRKIKIEFEKSYKCLNVERSTKDETIQKHLNNLLQRLEDIRVLLNVNYERLNTANKAAAHSFFLDIKLKISVIAEKKNYQLKLPENIHEEVQLLKQQTENKMSQTVVEFLNTASKLITSFDGKPENLRAFIDSLYLVDTIKGSHETIAVTLIKTKLLGTARNIIQNETTICEIINKLKTKVKGETVEVLSAKIMNTKQNNKTATSYCTEIENLTKSLENAYITDGVPNELAVKYSTQVAVKALTTNCSLKKSQTYYGSRNI